jgi:hypothetical protein
VLGVFLFGPRLVAGAAGTAVVLARTIGELPTIVHSLSSLDSHVRDMTQDVARMRAGVEVLGGEVRELRGELEGITELQYGIAALEPHLEHIRHSLGPFSRLGRRGAKRAQEQRDAEQGVRQAG